MYKIIIIDAKMYTYYLVCQLPFIILCVKCSNVILTLGSVRDLSGSKLYSQVSELCVCVWQVARDDSIERKISRNDRE